jgi:hypothetical protein
MGQVSRAISEFGVQVRIARAAGRVVHPNGLGRTGRLLKRSALGTLVSENVKQVLAAFAFHSR